MPPAIKHRDVLIILQVRLRDLALLQDQTVKEFSSQMSKINDQITETNSIISALLVQDSDELKEPVKNHDIKVKKEERVAIIKEFTSRRAFEVFMERKLSEKVLQDGLTAYFSDWSRIRNFLVHHAVVESSEVSNLERGLNDDFLAPAEKKKVVRFSSAEIEDKHKIEVFKIVNGVRSKRKNRNIPRESKETTEATSSKFLSDSSEENDSDNEGADINEKEVVLNGAEATTKRTDHPTRLEFLAFLSRMWVTLDFDVFGKGDDKVTGLKPSDVQEAFASHVHRFITADQTSIGLAHPIQYDQQLEMEILLPTQLGNHYFSFYNYVKTFLRVSF
jgi:hypothetical protein